MAIEIRETIVTPASDGDFVQLHISDVALDAEGATFRLVLLAKLPRYSKTPVFEQLQRAAMKQAQDALTEKLKGLATALEKSGYDYNPHS